MIIVLGVLVAFVLVLLLANRRTRACRWRRRALVNGRAEWRCVACGAEAQTDSPAPPRDCLAPGQTRG
ncbi:hypothetical protein BV394_11180 [Brevirhabdus pacifica]|uniref:Uncharacterized protein n=1 Tax=Brevirhabdus pacifica TaxID=1267768 RepID=A0A1U7DJP8_9RHOB|nr:hypothetical protein [Brevirhabdus pacifica]APX90220.1 hypothetical protein BV394_11180 [Brevirhabdus pacifica]OWU78727.1 hypothetical protein ATO5_08275 [Loktanella sp. 22II-4b]PJJ80653.1 hypothetical protein CLV77_2924 [Brevirhabdus pacifica]